MADPGRIDIQPASGSLSICIVMLTLFQHDEFFWEMPIRQSFEIAECP
jgi:hypothetical protein